MIARSFQHTGPGQKPEMMLPQWCRQIALGDSQNPIEVYNLTTTIDLSDVRDVVRAYRALLERGESGRAYNVGSGSAQQTGSVFDLLLHMAGSSRRVVELFPGVKHDPIADIGRLSAATGWRPRIPVIQTVRDTLHDWYSRRLENTGQVA